MILQECALTFYNIYMSEKLVCNLPGRTLQSYIWEPRWLDASRRYDCLDKGLVEDAGQDLSNFSTAFFQHPGTEVIWT